MQPILPLMYCQCQHQTHCPKKIRTEIWYQEQSCIFFISENESYIEIRDLKKYGRTAAHLFLQAWESLVMAGGTHPSFGTPSGGSRKWAAAARKTPILKFIPSPASDFWAARNLMRLKVWSSVQWTRVEEVVEDSSGAFSSTVGQDFKDASVFLGFSADFSEHAISDGSEVQGSIVTL